MATLEDLQQQLQLLKAQIDALTTPPNEYYTLLYSGEEVDELLGRKGGGTVKTVAGVGPDDDGNVPLTASSVKGAPDGFGLGNFPTLLNSSNDLNELQNKSGWYYWSTSVPLNAPTTDGSTPITFATFLSCGWTQLAFVADTKSILTRTIVSGVWSPWEWVNPPMLLGVEYRTAERYNGKPVYVKLVDFGLLPNNTTKTVSYEENASLCIDVKMILQGQSWKVINSIISRFTGSRDSILVTTIVDGSVYGTANVSVKYTKTTD